MLLLKSEAMVIRIGIKKQIPAKHVIFLFAAILIPGFKGIELDNYARAQRSFHEINEYARLQRDLGAYARAQRAATNFGNGNEDENGNELGSPEDQIDNMELNNQNDLIRELHESNPSDLHKVNVRSAMRLRRLRRGGEGSEYMSTSEPSQSHTVNVRSGMRLRRLRRGGEGSKNMRLRRLRRTEGSMEEKFQPMYLGKRPSYISPIESALNEMMANSICTVVGRLVPCIRSPLIN